MPRKLLAGCIVIALTTIPVAAFAARAYTVSGAQIFAGPGDDYPVVALLRQGVPVNINGCLSDYTWCDVSLGANRGWVYAQDLAYPYRNQRVLIPAYGPQLGLPLITFSLGNYWDRYYRGRPFYNERAHWEQNWRDYDHARANNRPDYRSHDRDNESRGNDFRDRQNVRNGQDWRDQQDGYRGDGQRHNPNWSNQQGATQSHNNQERTNQARPNQGRGEARTPEGGSMPDLPAGGQQGLPPGDHSRYQQ